MTTLIDKAVDESISEICAQHGDRSDALIEILHAAQARDGFLSDEVLRTIAHALNISRAEIHGVASFYHDFKRERPAKHCVKLCRAEACQAVGSEALAAHTEKVLQTKTGGRSADGTVDLEAVYCLGNCALGPAAMVDGVLQARMTPEKLDAALTNMDEAK